MISSILKLSRFAVLMSLGCLVAACNSGSPLHTPLTAVANIQLPRDTTTAVVDLLTLDSRVERLYVSHTSNDSLDIVDLRSRKVEATVGGLVAIKSIALTKNPDIVFTADADGTVGVVDVAKRQVVNRIDVGGGPDASDYDPVHDIVAVSLSRVKEVALIDASAQKVVARVKLPGDPELFAVDSQAGQFYLAIHSLDEVVVIDPVSYSITTTFKGCDIKAPTGLAIDTAQGKLFVADSGAILSIIDVVLDRCLGSVDIGHGTDQIAFNPHTRHVYTADGGSRYVSVIDSPTMKPLGVNGTGPSASTIAVDPTTDTIYIAVKRPGIIAVYHDP